MAQRLSPARAQRELARVWSKVRRRLARVDRRTVQLGAYGECRGRAVFSFVLDPFLARRPSLDHTHDWESLEMVEALRERGLSVDILHWSNTTWVPPADVSYDLLVDVRLNLERLAPLVGPDCLRIFHAETAHRGVHDAAQLARHAALRARRGIDLAPNRLLEANRAVETCDAMTLLGNNFTRNSYAFAAKPTWRVPISNPLTYPLPQRDWASAARTFLWFGSGGLVHKGLDLVLEAFAGMPELRLLVAGPIERERGFEAAFARELYHTPNIELLGWVDVGSSRFLEVAQSCGLLVYPSCSEGGGGSAITCMHAGIIPMLTASASVDLDPTYGWTVEADVSALQRACRAAAQTPAPTLASMAAAAWSFARTHHTRETFATGWRQALDAIFDQRDELMAWRRS